MTDFLLYFNNHLILFVMCLSLLIFLFTTSRIDMKDRKLLLLIVASIMLLALCEYIETLFNADHVDYENLTRYIFSSICYAIRPVIIVLFYHIRFKPKGKWALSVWIPAIVNAIIYIVAIFGYKNPAMKFAYWYDANNHFGRSWPGYIVFVICAVYLVGLIVSSIIQTTRKKTRRQIDLIILFTSALAILAQGVAMVISSADAHTSDVYAVGAALYFIFLSYDKAANEAIAHERERQENTTALMLSQIQPHFIYNTLTTIQVLCEIDPEKAVKIIDSFTKYLRMNTDALSKKEPVPVLEEVKHRMTYADIEMVRFDNVKVLFAIKDKDFKLPVLTVEPILENAIKYGVRARKEGRVEVSTYKEGNNHVLVVKDNGVGFDMEKVKADGREHIGINNVKTRIENMVHGTFEVYSALNKGTTVTITIPEEKS